jgi:hypothetical protein
MSELNDRYLLRELVWCGPCDVPMKPATHSTNRRCYGCTNPTCPRPLFSAALLDVVAWQAFLYLFADPTIQLTRPEQRQALEIVLERVTVGRDLGDLRYQWRDLP